MRIIPATAFVVGDTASTVWSQVLSLPGVYVLIELKDSDPETATLRGNRLMTNLMEKLRQPPEGLLETETFIRDLVKEGVTSAVLLTISGKTAFIAQIGNSVSYIKRGAMLARLVNGSGSVSGELQSGDMVLLFSESIRQILDETQLSASFDHLSAMDLSEKLTLILHEKTGRFFGSAFIYEVCGFEEDPPKTEIPPEINQRNVFPIARIVTRQRLLRVARRIKSGRIPTIGEIRYRFHNAADDSKRVVLTVLIILGLMFLVSVFLGIRKISSSTANTKITAAMDQAQHAFDEGVALRDLNPLKSRERLKTAKQTLEPYKSKVSGRSKIGYDFNQLYKLVDDNLILSMQINSVKPELFYDLSLLKNGSRASVLARVGDTLAVTDSSTNTVFAVGLSSKSGQMSGSGDFLTGIRFVDIGGDNIYVYAESGVYKIPLVGKTDKKPIISKDDTWGNIGGLVTFGGNIYLLDTQKSRIWKYVATETGFTDRREYLNPDTLPNLSQATNFAIDGSVWVGTKTGTVIKFTQGQEQTFEFKGIEPALGNTLMVYTSDDSNNLYVLDISGKRVVVTDKEGMYLSQYVYNLAGISGFTVSESAKKVLLLSSGLIYSFNLK
jgi:hypothetical protein